MKQKLFLIISILTAFLLLFVSCKKQETQDGTGTQSSDGAGKSQKTSGVVIFLVGEVRIENRKLALGDVITDNEILNTGKKSLCDIQILESKSGVVIRLKSDSEFQLNPSVTPEGSDVNLALRKGAALFKVNNKLAKNESVRVKMPTMVAGVRGTSFSANISAKGDVDLQVLEGSVTARPSISEIDSLPPELKEKSTSVQTIEKNLSESEQIIEAGQKTSVSKAYTDKILKDTGLQTVLPQINESIKKGDLTSASQKLDSVGGTPEESKTKIAEKLSSKPALKVEKTNEKDLQSQLKEFEELIAIEKEKMDKDGSRKTAISARNKDKNNSLLKRIEQITGKSAETLILKDGSRIQGVVLQEGDTYHVLTTEGKKSYPESAVEGTEF